MKLNCDGVRRLGSLVIYPWTSTGYAAKTANALTVHGWEECDLSDDLQVKVSRGRYEAEDQARKVADGTAGRRPAAYCPRKTGGRRCMNACIASPRSSECRNAAFHTAT